MTSQEIRKRYLTFFEKRDHAILPSASLIPENDPSVLFNTAGMQPLVPYLLGREHPKGKRLVNVQKCVRTGDIEEIGDNTHLTFFEMMGNWSLGDYFKKEAIEWSFELLTSKSEGFGLDPRRLFVTCFEGDENAPRDEESEQIWREIFAKNNVSGERIYFLPAKNNWWSPGDNGPCGPDTEMFYDLTGTLGAPSTDDATSGDKNGLTKEEFLRADEDQEVVEIWNDVFMEYLKKDGKVIGKLETKNVDTGSGFERVVAVLQNKTNVFDTDLFEGVMGQIEKFSANLTHSTTSPNSTNTTDDTRAKRIVVDHIRTAVFMIAEGVLPSNTDRGYVLRRLIRRAVRYADKTGLKDGATDAIIKEIVRIYKDIYENLADENRSGNRGENFILSEIQKEEARFRQTLEKGLLEFEKGTDPFILFTTYGFPFELTKDLAKEKGREIDEQKFQQDLEAHQNLSRAGAEQKFKGGLGDTSEMSVKYHTATHLLNAALKKVLGNSVNQKGSNITPERLRFDFSHDSKMTDEQKKSVENIVNEAIAAALPVSFESMPTEKARELGAVGVFGERYPDTVTVYTIGDGGNGEIFSREICGGPHVENTGTLGRFKIAKEEAISQGVRRIKAILE